MQGSKSNFFAKSEKRGRFNDWDNGYDTGGRNTKGKKFREKADFNKMSRRNANRNQDSYE